MDQHRDDFTSRLDQIDHSRRQVGQSIAASGMSLRRALEATGEMPSPAENETERAGVIESWPRGMKVPPRRYPRTAAVIFLLIAGVVAGAALLPRGPAGPPAAVGAAPLPGAPSAPVPKAISAPPAVRTESEPMVIQVRAMRPCRVRVVVDGTALDWREMKEGDEFVSRPAHDILIESNDAGALAATVNGKLVRLGDDGQKLSVRLPPPV